MSDDIVSRLREDILWWGECKDYCGKCGSCLEAEAADEIERLRKELPSFKMMKQDSSK